MIIYGVSVTSRILLISSSSADVAGYKWRITSAGKEKGKLKFVLTRDEKGLPFFFKSGNYHLGASAKSIVDHLPKFNQTAPEEVIVDKNFTEITIIMGELKTFKPRASSKYALPAAPQVYKHRLPLAEVIRELNIYKSELGEALILEINAEGNLRGLMEFI